MVIILSAVHFGYSVANKLTALRAYAEILFAYAWIHSDQEHAPKYKDPINSNPFNCIVGRGGFYLSWRHLYGLGNQ